MKQLHFGSIRSIHPIYTKQEKVLARVLSARNMKPARKGFILDAHVGMGGNYDYACFCDPDDRATHGVVVVESEPGHAQDGDTYCRFGRSCCSDGK